MPTAIGCAFSGSTDAGANADWTISVSAATPNQFTLVGSTGDGGGTGGTVKNIQGVSHGRQASPNLSLTADPSNANLVYVGGDDEGFPSNGDSSIGTTTFTARIFRGDASVAAQGAGAVVSDATHQWSPLINSGASGTAPHADTRALIIANGQLLYSGDGGIFAETSPTNSAGQWISRNGAPNGANNGLQITQFSSEISYDTVSNIIFGGAQDTGTPQQSATGSMVYVDQSQGDGPFTAVDDLTSPIQSARYIGFFRQIYNSSNVLVGPSVALLPANGVNGSFYNFNALAVGTVASPAGQSARLVIANGNGAANAKATGAAGTAIFESANAALAVNSAGIVYTQIPTGAGWSGVNSFFNIFAMAVGGKRNGVVNPDLLYAGSGSQVFLRSTAGGTLTATAGQPAGAGTIQDIAVDPNDWMTAYVTDGTNVFETSNAGATWTNITGNLNDTLIHTITVADNSTGLSAVLVGQTDGVFRMLSNAPGVWTKFGSGFPNSSVWGIAYSAGTSPTTNVLVAGTSGRGAFEIQNVDASLFSQNPLEIFGDSDYADQNDSFRLVRDASNNLLLDVFINNSTSVPTYQVPLALVPQINIYGGGGQNTLTIDDSNGLITVPNGITFNGGDPGPGQTGAGQDGRGTLVLTQSAGSTAQTSDVYTPGPNPGQGTDVIIGPTGVQSVYFTELAPVYDNVLATTATVNGTAATNAINYTQGTGNGIFGTDKTGLVTVDNLESYEFSQKQTLVINGGAGNDEINLNNPIAPTGMSTTTATPGVTVAGGDPTASNHVIVNGTAGQDNITFSPTAANAATITGAGPVTIALATVANVTINGQGGLDNLTVATPAGPDVVTLDAGVLSDQGTVAIRRSLGGGGSQLLGMKFTNLGSDDAVGRLSFISTGGAREDGLSVDDYPIGRGGDQFLVSAAGVVDLITSTDGRAFLSTATMGIATLTLNGAAGDDRFDIAGAVPFTTLQLTGGTSLNDVVNLSGASGAVTVTSADASLSTPTSITGYGGTISLSGVEIVNLNANSNAATVLGDGQNDSLTVTPTGAATATVQSAGLGTIFNFSNISGAFTIDGAGGINSVAIQGTSGDDAITAAVNASASTKTVVTVNSLLPVNIVTANAASLAINGGLGNDLLTVDSSNGPVTLPITYDGGAGTNALKLVGGTATADSYTPGSQLGSGVDALTFAGGSELIHFQNLAPIFDLVAGPLLVNASNAANAINYVAGFSSLANFLTGTSSATWGQVSVDSAEPIEFINKTSLTINALAGGDVITLNNPNNTPTGLTGITANGQDPAAGDTLIVNGTVGADSMNYRPTSADAGSITGAGAVAINFATIEQVTINGQGGNDSLTYTSPAGAGNNLAFTPGATSDAGTITGQIVGGSLLAPLSFTNLGAAGALTFATSNEGKSDVLDFYGTGASDQFNVMGRRGRCRSSVPAVYLRPSS